LATKRTPLSLPPDLRRRHSFSRKSLFLSFFPHGKKGKTFFRPTGSRDLLFCGPCLPFLVRAADHQSFAFLFAENSWAPAFFLSCGGRPVRLFLLPHTPVDLVPLVSFFFFFSSRLAERRINAFSFSQGVEEQASHFFFPFPRPATRRMRAVFPLVTVAYLSTLFLGRR